VFAFNGGSNTATVIDAALGTSPGKIELLGKPEFAVSDEKGTVFVNIEDKNSIQVIDAKAMKVKKTYSVSPCDSPGGLSMDRKNRLLFVSCDNKMLAVIEADSGKVVTTLPIGEGPDATQFDPGKNIVFSSNGKSGTLTVIQEVTPKSFKVIQNLETQKGARTMALDEKTHRLFLVTASFDPAPEATKDNPKPRPALVKGSVVGVVVSPKL